MGGSVLGRIFSHHDPNPIFALSWFMTTALYAARRKPDRVIFTMPPGVVVIGAAWCKMTGIPYVLDYRDYWQERNMDVIKKKNGVASSAAMLLERFYEWFAGEANTAALMVVTVHEKIIDKLAMSGPTKPLLMSNGIDADDVRDSIVLAASTKMTNMSRGKRIIAYVGQLGLRYYSPEIILGPFSKQLAEDKDIELWIFSSTTDPDFEKAVEEANLQNMVKFFNLPHTEMLAMLRHASVGLIPLRPDDSQAEFVFPAKLYDYLASGVPVLALSDEDSFISKFITEHGLGINVKWGSEKDLHDALRKLIAHGEFKQRAMERSVRFCMMFDRKSQFKEFFRRLT